MRDRHPPAFELVALDSPGRYRLSGEFGFGTAAAALARGNAEFARHPHVEVDLGGVTDADSAGLAVLLAWTERLQLLCAEHGTSMAAAALHYSLRSPLVDSTVVGVSSPHRREQLDELVQKARAGGEAGYKLEVIVVVGHADSTGSAALNERLSLARAEAVKKFLVDKGVEPNRIYTEGKGSRQPIADNKTAQGRQQNRRVEIEIVGTKTVVK